MQYRANKVLVATLLLLALSWLSIGASALAKAGGSGILPPSARKNISVSLPG